MEQNKEMTASESLALIAETMNNNRREIVRHSGKYFVMWGILLTVFSLLVYILWKTTGNAVWNNLWFALPVVGFPLARLLRSKENPVRAENYISRINGGIWGTFGLFACSIALFTVLFGVIGDNPLASLVAGASLTAMIVLLFGMAETISGIVLKNWAIKIAGFLTGIGGVAIYYITGANEEQMLIFTFAGIVLTATGLIIKNQYK
ncbi:MAG: hypothetical protein IKX60_01040 [Bacteroidales bacterium]|nr:hypothetical protein [Bacteroidales bacterium]